MSPTTCSRPRRLRRLAVALATLSLAALTAQPSWAGSSGTHSGTHAHRHDRTVVAMGDSFASGEGTFDYRADTDTATNRCHRSDQAYGAVLARYAGGRLVACSGAVTGDLLTANHLYPDEPAQVDALSRRTRLVTLGIGGNDLGFSTLLARCLAGARTPAAQCSIDPGVQSLVDGKLAALAGRASDPSVVSIKRLLREIRSRAPYAEIVVVGYPRLLGSDSSGYTADPTVPSGLSCALEPTRVGVLDYADAQWVNRTTDRLNAVLRSATRHRYGVSFAPASTFDGHGLCDRRNSWINPLVPGAVAGRPGPESVHPTTRGQRALLVAVLAELSREVRRSVSVS